MAVLRRIWVESLTVLLFICEFGTNLLRFVGLGRRYYRKNNRLDGRVVVVTGANSGIGKQTVLHLSGRGAKVWQIYALIKYYLTIIFYYVTQGDHVLSK